MLICSERQTLAMVCFFSRLVVLLQMSPATKAAFGHEFDFN